MQPVEANPLSIAASPKRKKTAMTPYGHAIEPWVLKKRLLATEGFQRQKKKHRWYREKDRAGAADASDVLNCRFV